MADYSYDVSLRFRHPSVLPAEITSVLQLEPVRSWAFGEPRRTPKGAPLKGVYKESYWVARMAHGSSGERELADALGSVLDRIEDHKLFFHDFAASGGRSELFVGWYFDDGNSGDVLRHGLLARLAELRIDLALDIYPTRSA